jgi:hypothetical protein
MSTTHFNNYKLQLDDWAASEEGQEGDKSLIDYMEATDPKKDKATRIRLTLGEPEALILAVKHVQATNEEGDEILGQEKAELRFLHSPTIIGGTKTRKSTKLIVLEGLTHDAKPLIMNGDQAFKGYKITTPPIENIENCIDVQGLKDLDIPQTTTGQLKCSGIFLLPPWAMRATIKADTKDPLELLLFLKNEAAVFDTAHEDDPEYPQKGSVEIRPALRWLFSVAKLCIDPTTLLDEPDTDAQAHKQARDSKCILPPFSAATGAGVPPAGPPLPPGIPTEASALMSVMAQNNAVLSKMADTMEIGAQLTATHVNLLTEKQNKKLNRVEKLHGSVPKLLRFAAASSDDDVADSIPPSATSFFNCETVGKATQEFYQQLAALKVRRVAVATGTLQSLKEGDFLWKNDTTPANLSVFMFGKAAAGAQSIGHTALILHYQETIGKDWSESELKKSLKQAIIVPSTYHCMIEQMERFLGVLRLFEGKTGYLPNKYASLIEQVRELQDKIEEGQETNPKFIAGFLYLTDVRVHEFHKRCIEAASRDEVRNTILNWRPILDRIEMQEFVPNLPSSFTLVSKPTDTKPPATKHGLSDADTDTNPNPSKKKRQGHGRPSDTSFALLEGEELGQFCSEAAVKTLPKWRSSDCKWCPKFHINGKCHTRCKDAESHKAKGIKDGEKKTFKGWMDSVRSTSTRSS